MTAFLRLVSDAAALLRERRCVACATPVPAAECNGPSPLCVECAKGLLRRSGGYCPTCGNMTALPKSAPLSCGECMHTPKPWGGFFFHGEYRGLLRDLILRFKNGHELALAQLFGNFLAAHPGIHAEYDAVLPMPLHTARLRERGFNQALELARPLARTLGAPLLPSVLTREENTRPQAGLSLEARKKNVRNIFAVTGDVAGRRLLLIDDIATTCASLESAANALIAAGAGTIDVAVVARTPEYSAL